MKRVFIASLLFLFSFSAFATEYPNFYVGCIKLDPDHLAAMRWIRAYYDDEGDQSTEKLKLECGKAFKFLLQTHSLKLNYDTSKMRCPEATCKLHSISFLRHFPNIRMIELNGHRIQDLTPLESLPNLIEVSLEDNLIRDITPLQNMSKLKVLNLHDNLIEDASPIAQLAQLIAVDLSRNELHVLPEDLSSLSHLKELLLNFNHLQEYSAINQLTGLSILEMSHNELSSFQGLDEALPHVKVLSLQANQLNDISALNLASTVEELNLTMNQISSFSPLSKLHSLKHAELGGNNVSYESCLNMLHPHPKSAHLCSSINHWNDRF